jgi:hypothetical protein
MDLLTKFLLKEVLDNQKVVAIYGGGFKPPTKGHFAVAKKTLDDFPEIDELKIFVGGGVRDGITQDESIKIWNIYKSLLPDKIDVEPSVAPVKSVLGYAKDHPEEKVYWILGAREGDEDDLKDIESRTRSIDKYPNIEVKVITTTGGVSGTKTRQAIRDNNKEQFFHMIPDVSDEEKEQIWDMTSTVIKEELLKEEAFVDKLKNKLKNIINAVKQESKETKQAFSLLIKSANGDIELTDLQQQFIKEQMVDLLKSLGLVTLAIMPAGSLVALLLKALKLSSYVTPSAFLNEIGDTSAKSYPFTVDTDPSKLVDTAKEYHKTHTSHTYYQTKLTYRFKTDKANYVVTFAVSMERKRYINFTGAPNFKPGPPYDTYVEVGFNIDGETEERNTNLNEQFSVLSTVTKIIFDFIDKLNASGGNLMILYIGAKNDTDSSTKLDSKRGKLYAAYLKKNLSKLPGYDAREHTNDDGNEFIQIYKKGSVNEVGEANLKPYKWEEVDVEGYFVYTRFTTDNETQYDVDIKSTVYYPPGQMDSVPALEIEFSAKPKGAEGSSAKIVVNKGEMYRVMATIVNIIKKYIKKSRAEAIIYSPSKKSDEETFGTQRDNLYRAFISKAFPETTFKQSGDNITAILPNNAALTLDEADPIKEQVTSTQVICDNCGWEWAIKDGGKDLYVCHKCGHDNTPKSDPFGLNELAKQFGEEVGRDLTKGWNPQKDFVSLSIFMIDNGMNIKPLPKIKVIKDDKENASDLLGKTAYYDPSNKSITLYTFGRHPKDILRSFAHEMIHHEQNLNGKLGNITTTNTNEDGDLPEIEKEAYEKGNMMLRNWEDSIKNV